MAIIIDESTRVVVQGITGGQGKFHTRVMREYGTNVVAGVTPGKGGGEVDGIPVYDSIREVMELADASIIFVPAPFARDAALEAISGGMDPVVIITEHIPVHDSIEIMDRAVSHGTRIIGPNTPGILSADKCKMGVMPSHIFKKGSIGLISRSGTLTYEIVDALSRNALGQTTTVGLGGDPIVGLGFIELLDLFEADNETEAVVLIGEIGGNAEELAAEHIKQNISKPVIGYIAGRTAPPGKTMGHAGAIISGSAGTAKAKIEALQSANIKIAEKPGDIPELVKSSI
ncbi:MAG: succinate--CoA ligase subunit alpha [Thermoplasmata archaeon]|nr:MAG: succinate--CoA ligase subunit alpha [Thermoplasmata archaeon]